MILRKRATRSWRAALVAVPLALVASACLPAPRAWVGDGPRVLVFGDSLTHRLERGADNDPRKRLLTNDLVAGGYAASVSSMTGAKTLDLAAVVPTIPDPGPDILLISLGSNDMRVKDGATLTPLATAIDNVRAAMTQVAAKCTVLVTVAETAPWGLDTDAPAFNQALRALPNVVIADWAPLVAANPLFVTEDGVHHTDLGVGAYRDLYRNAIGSCARAL